MNRRRWLSVAAALPLAAQDPQGERMPRFQARTLDGEVHTRESLQGKVVLLQHWATWCSYCRREEPLVEQILKDHAKDGLIVLAINAAEPRATVEAYLKEHRRTAKIVLTPDTNLGQLFEGTGVPAYILIGRDGRIAALQPGAGGLMGLRGMLKEAGLNKPDGK